MSLQDAISAVKNSVSVMKRDITFTVKRINNYFSPISLSKDVISVIDNDMVTGIKDEILHLVFDTKYTESFFKNGIPYFYSDSSLHFATQGFPYTTGKTGKVNAQKINMFCALYYNVCDAEKLSKLLLESEHGKAYASVLSEMLAEKTVFQIDNVTVGLYVCNDVLNEVKTSVTTDKTDKVKKTVK